MKISKNDYIKIILCALVLSLIFAIPFLKGQIKVGADTTFHLNRIEALSIAIKQGDFFPRVFLEQNYGFGYGSPMFYSIIYLYPAAFLRLVGISPANTYRIYSIMLAFFCALSIMIVTYKISNSKKMYPVYIVGALYVLNNFMLNRIFKRGAIGEMLAMIFVPIVIYAVMQTLYKHKNNWVMLGTSFSLLFYAHNISFILMVVLFFVLILINFKKVIKDKIFMTIIKATILGTLLSLFYIIPMLEQLRNNIYYINFSFTKEDVYLQGGTFLDLLSSEGNDYVNITAGIGVSLFILPLLSSLKNKDSRIYMVIGYIMLFLTTKYFPWHYVTFLNIIQFPSRTLVVAIPLLCIASYYCIENIKEYSFIVKPVTIISLLMSLLSFANTAYELSFKTWGAINDSTTSEMIKSGKDLYLDQDINFWYNIPEISSPEYLPVYSYDYYDGSVYRKLYTEKNEFDLSYNNYNEMAFEVLLTENDLEVVFPKTYYRGYYVDIYKDGMYQESVKATCDKEGRFASATIPDQYKDSNITLILVYKGTIFQKISMLVSILTFTLMVAYVFFKKSRLKMINKCN